jgi:hypothetical protein
MSKRHVVFYDLSGYTKCLQILINGTIFENFFLT